MDNNPVNPSHGSDEEYQFTDDEGSRKYESSAGASSAFANRSDDQGASRKKLILIIIGVVVGVFCLYKLYDLFTVAPSKTPLAPAQTQTALPIPPVAQKPEQINSSQPPVISEEKFDKEGFKDKVSSLEKAVVQNSQTQENLQNQIGGISSAITEIQDNIAMLTQQINTLAQQKSTAESKSQEKEKAKPAQESETAVVKKRVEKRRAERKNQKINHGEYYVRAMIQGRAWLMSSSGATFTISSGDQLLGYGQIREIDPEKGMIMTSSGRVISYMPRDR